MDAVTPLVPDECVPFVGEALRRLRSEVGNQAAVLGFVGAPFTLATYIVEGMYYEKAIERSIIR